MMMKPLHFGFLVTPKSLFDTNRPLWDEMKSTLIDPAVPAKFADVWSPSQSDEPTIRERLKEETLVLKLAQAKTPFLYKPDNAWEPEDDDLLNKVFKRIPAAQASTPEA